VGLVYRALIGGGKPKPAGQAVQIVATAHRLQFTSEEFTKVLRDHGIEISMDGRGRCHDNIFVERLWWTVKHEWVYLRPAANGLEQERSLGEFFDWYNLLRPHQALGWRTPDEAYLGRRHWPPDAVPRCGGSGFLDSRIS
jgi:putative transposase